MQSLILIAGVVFLIGLGWGLSALAGPLIAAALLVVLLTLEYGRKQTHDPAVPFFASAFAIGIVWFIVTNLSAIVVIGRG